MQTAILRYTGTAIYGKEDAVSQATPPAIELEDVTFAYPDGPPVLRDISLTISAGESVAIIGVNGSGKTTLLLHLIGLLHPQQGSVRINGLDTREVSVAMLARHVGFAFQKPEHQLFSPTVRDEIAFGPRNQGLHGTALEARVAETLAQFGLSDLANHPPAVMSFSQRRLIALASIAALHTPILALDEPLVGLDGLWRRRVIAWLQAHLAAGGTSLLVTHQLRLAGKARRVLAMHRGRLVADGPPGEIFAHPELLAAVGLTAHLSVALGHALGLPQPALRIRDLLEALTAPAEEDRPGLPASEP